MKKIEEEMYKVHQQSKQQSQPSHSTTASTIQAVSVPKPRPFAKINEVSSGSPAEAAGLKVNDIIVSFGSVNAHNHNNLKAVAELVRLFW